MINPGFDNPIHAGLFLLSIDTAEPVRFCFQLIQPNSFVFAFKWYSRIRPFRSAQSLWLYKIDVDKDDDNAIIQWQRQQVKNINRPFSTKMIQMLTEQSITQTKTVSNKKYQTIAAEDDVDVDRAINYINNDTSSIELLLSKVMETSTEQWITTAMKARNKKYHRIVSAGDKDVDNAMKHDDHDSGSIGKSMLKVMKTLTEQWTVTIMTSIEKKRGIRHS